MRDRSFAREMAKEHYRREHPTAWFDILYRNVGGDANRIPWGHLETNPNLREWLDRERPAPSGMAVVVGSGLGDDARELASRGWKVTGFDVAPTAVEWATKRFVGTGVDFVNADLFDLPTVWQEAFGFVFEAYTIQALPPEVRERAISQVASLVAPGGLVLVVCRARNPEDDPGDMPWPLTEAELMGFTRHGLCLVNLEDYLDREEPPVRRFRAVFERKLSAIS